MFKNYIKTAFRNFKKNKTTALINVIGLAVGFAVCILLLLYVQDELSYDQFHKNADRLYRITEGKSVYSSPVLAKLFTDNFPEIEKAVRILPREEWMFEYQDQRFYENNVFFADANLFDVFSFKLKSGDAATVLKNPFTLVMAEDMAQKYFGDEDPIGKTVRVNSEYIYTVAGVMEEIPKNSHFSANVFLALNGSEAVFGEEWFQSWGWQNFPTYFLMRDGFSKQAFEQKANQLIAGIFKNKPQIKATAYKLQNIKDIHLHSSYIENDVAPQGQLSYILIFSGIGVLILLIACFNYINLLTANASTRAKEVGVKKVVGASQNQLAGQFIGESMVVLTFSFIIALGLVELCFPMFNSLTGKYLTFFNLFNMRMFFSVLAILSITALIAGGYPAFVLSSLQPAKVIKSSAQSMTTKSNFRRILVGAQFTVSIALIICAIFMFNQMNYLQNKNLGFNKDQVLIAQLQNPENEDQFTLLKNLLLKNSDILHITAGSRYPTENWGNWTDILLSGKTESKSVRVCHINDDYFETFGIKTAQGRLFSEKFKTDEANAIILNESLVRELGIEGDPIGQQLQIGWPYSTRTVVGVVEDFHNESLYQPIQAIAFVLHQPECCYLAVKIRPTNIPQTIQFMEKTWREVYPDWIFKFQFLDQRINQIYKSDRNTFALMGYFTFLAIFVACMGLFGLISHIIKRRSKEIGIRKILSAPVSSIVSLLVKDFMKWILIANVIAWPIAWFAMNKWLQNFAYRIDMTIWPFLVAGTTTFALALLTVSWQTVKAALANPVDSLKYE